MTAYFDSGFCVRQPSWHRQELLLTDYPTDWQDAREKAGLMWEPAIKPIYALDDRVLACMVCAAPLNTQHVGHGKSDAICPLAIVNDDGAPSFVTPECIDGEMLKRGIMEDVDHRLVIRDDTYAPLGTVSDEFSLIFHSQMGEILEAVIGERNVKFETAGSVKGGAMVWALAYIDEPYTVAGDDTETFPFLALLNSHDGTGACKLARTQVRVVCWNTYQAASLDGDRSGQQFVFRHVGDVTGRIEDAKAALAGARSEAAEWSALAQELFDLKLNDEDAAVQAFMFDFPGLVSPREHGKPTSDRVEANVDRARSVFKRLYFDSVTTESHRGTALGLVDASVEYLDHVRGFQSTDTYLGRTMFKSEPLKARAVSLIRRIAVNA